VLSFTPLLLFSGETAPGTHYIEGWVGPGAGLEVVEKRKISCLYQESNTFFNILKLWIF
jgi:hypothetical protein